MKNIKLQNLLKQYPADAEIVLGMNDDLTIPNVCPSLEKVIPMPNPLRNGGDRRHLFVVAPASELMKCFLHITWPKVIALAIIILVLWITCQ